MYDSFLIKYGEIGIKGDNRHIFEGMPLQKQIHLLWRKSKETLRFEKNGDGSMWNCAGTWDYDETVTALTMSSALSVSAWLSFTIRGL